MTTSTERLMANRWGFRDSEVRTVDKDGILVRGLFDTCPYEAGHSLRAHRRHCMVLAERIVQDHNRSLDGG